MKILMFPSKKLLFGLVLLALLPHTGHAQQINERTGYNFRTAKTGLGLSRAIAIEQQRNGGFGTRQTVTNNTTITQNTSSSIGTLTEVEAILNGDNSEIGLSATTNSTSSGTQTSTSDQRQ